MILTVIYIFLSGLTAALGALLLKRSSKEGIFTWNLIFGIVLYGFSFIFLFLSLIKLPLSIAYNIAAPLTYIFAFIFGHIILKERFTIYKLYGIVLILFGILLVSFSAL